MAETRRNGPSALNRRTARDSRSPGTQIALALVVLLEKQDEPSAHRAGPDIGPQGREMSVSEVLIEQRTTGDRFSSLHCRDDQVKVCVHECFGWVKEHQRARFEDV